MKCMSPINHLTKLNKRGKVSIRLQENNQKNYIIAEVNFTPWLHAISSIENNQIIASYQKQGKIKKLKYVNFLFA